MSGAHTTVGIVKSNDTQSFENWEFQKLALSQLLWPWILLPDIMNGVSSVPGHPDTAKITWSAVKDPSRHPRNKWHRVRAVAWFLCGIDRVGTGSERALRKCCFSPNFGQNQARRLCRLIGHPAIISRSWTAVQTGLSGRREWPVCGMHHFRILSWRGRIARVAGGVVLLFRFR